MSQTAKKWIKADAIDGTKIRLNNNENLRGRNFANTVDLNIGKVNASDEWEFGIEPHWGTYPTTGSSLVNKDYVVDVIAGLRNLKDACRVASTGAMALSGLGVSLLIDGVTVMNTDRVLLKDQSPKDTNGIYTVSDVGVNIALTRATDADTSVEVTQGMAVDIAEGLANGRTRWLLTTSNPINLGVTLLTFVEIPNPSTLVQFKEEQFVLTGTDITNQYVDLTNAAEPFSILVFPDDGISQRQGTDYTLSNPVEVTRITFSGDMATAGAAALVATDVLVVKYAHYS